MDLGAPVILLVEDDPNDQLLFTRAVRKAGIPAVIDMASDGDAAIAHLSEAANPPSLMLLDLKLPRRSGFEVLAWIKAHPELRRVPVVVLTSSDQTADIQRAYDLGANSYLVKPGNSAELQDLVRELARYWFEINQLEAR